VANAAVRIFLRPCWAINAWCNPSRTSRGFVPWCAASVRSVKRARAVSLAPQVEDLNLPGRFAVRTGMDWPAVREQQLDPAFSGALSDP
jgi:hypothetical protein